MPSQSPGPALQGHSPLLPLCLEDRNSEASGTARLNSICFSPLHLLWWEEEDKTETAMPNPGEAPGSVTSCAALASPACPQTLLSPCNMSQVQCQVHLTPKLSGVRQGLSWPLCSILAPYPHPLPPFQPSSSPGLLLSVGDTPAHQESRARNLGSVLTSPSHSPILPFGWLLGTVHLCLH